MQTTNPIEPLVGMKYYWTTTPQIPGYTKLEPEDFIVQEILPTNQITPITPTQMITLPGDPGLYVHAILIKRKIDHFTAIKHVSKALKIPEKQISIAGIKDTYALTSQRISFWLQPSRIPKTPLNILNNSLILFNYQQKREPVYLGDLKGNAFTITIRNTNASHQSIINDVLHSPIPNYYGIQRFGAKRPVTHKIGKALLKGEYKRAIDIFLGEYSPHEPKENQEFRKLYQNTNDYQYLLEHCPKPLQPERRILGKLMRHHQDYLGAFRSLPKNFLSLFLYSYQSYLFNHYLTRRIQREQAPTEPLEGERIKQGRVQAMVPGDQRKPKSVAGEIYQEILEDEAISFKDLTPPKELKIKIKRFWRDIFTYPQQASITQFNPHQGTTVIKFSLEKGQYATNVLREIMKSSPLDYTANSEQRVQWYSS